jgi:cobalt/nickel transport system permease protein
MSGLCGHHADVIGLAGDPASPVHRLDPRTKLLAFMAVTVVAVSTPLAAWPVWLACVVVLTAVAVRARVDAGTIWRRARIVLPLVLLVGALVPFVRDGGTSWELGPLSVSSAGLAVFATVAAKATIGTLSAVLLAATTTFPDVLRALERLRAPRLLILVASFMYRYLFVIRDEVHRMRAALASRGYRPRHALQAGALGRVASALFLRSFARGERVYLAMLARGYRGRMPAAAPLRLVGADLAFGTAVIASLLAVRLGVEVTL